MPIYIKQLLGLFGGFMHISTGFITMHDASHFAVTHRPGLNSFLSRLWNSLSCWNHYIWLKHHVYGHHSFTGDGKLDPDAKNSRPIFRKYKDDQNILKFT